MECHGSQALRQFLLAALTGTTARAQRAAQLKYDEDRESTVPAVVTPQTHEEGVASS